MATNNAPATSSRLISRLGILGAAALAVSLLFVIWFVVTASPPARLN
jgi:hypothetical protein